MAAVYIVHWSEPFAVGSSQWPRVFSRRFERAEQAEWFLRELQARGLSAYAVKSS